MPFDTLIQTGSFTSTGLNKTLKIRSGIDKLVVINETEWVAQTLGAGVRYTWFTGMGSTALTEYHPAADHTLAVNTVAGAINIVDSSDYPLGAVTAVTAGTDAARPVYSTADTTGLVDGSVVRIFDTDHDNLNGFDFTIDNVVLDTSFRLANSLATFPGRVAGANGTYRMVAPNIETYTLFKPGHRNVCDITTDVQAWVTTLVDHGYLVGQKVKFKVPTLFGMTDVNEVTANVISVLPDSFQIDLDTRAFTAFTFPTYANEQYDPAIVTPVGDAKSSVSQLCPSAIVNQGYVGVVLTAGDDTLPGGNLGDVVRWTVYTSENVDNE